MMNDVVLVVCPVCCEGFEIAAPPLGEVPCEIDYDCEICCRPMLISLWADQGEVVGEAAGLSD